MLVQHYLKIKIKVKEPWSFFFSSLYFFSLPIHCCCCLVVKSCPTLCNPMDCSPPGPSLSVGSSRQECWSELPFPSPGDLPRPGIKPVSLALAGRFFTTDPPGKPLPTHSRCWLSTYCILDTLYYILLVSGSIHYWILYTRYSSIHYWILDTLQDDRIPNRVCFCPAVTLTCWRVHIIRQL